MSGFLCPLCGAKSYTKKGPYRSESVEFAGKTIVECNNCKLISAYPLPSDEDLIRYYKSYWDRQKEGYSATMPLFVAQAKSRYEFLKQYLKRSKQLRVLDVGAGFGLINNFLKKGLGSKLFRYDVTEVDSMAIEYLKDNIMPHEIYSDLKECRDKYDLIILSHIIEHFKDPLTFLTQQHGLIAQDGILFIEVPNQDYLHKKWHDPHLMFFSPATITQLAEKAGYKIIKIASCGQLLEDLVKKKSGQAEITLLERIHRKLFRNKHNEHFYDAIRRIRTYGPDRAWIRMVARLKENV